MLVVKNGETMSAAYNAPQNTDQQCVVRKLCIRRKFSQFSSCEGFMTIKLCLCWLTSNTSINVKPHYQGLKYLFFNTAQ